MSLRCLHIAIAVALLSMASLAHAGARLALLPIAVHAAGSDTQYLSTGLSEMISARLEQYDGLVVVRPATEPVAPDEAGKALEQARAAGADFVLYGSFTQFGDGASLDLRCARVEEASSEDPPADATRRVFIQSGTVAEIIPKLDTLAEKVARYTFETASPVLAGANDGASDNGGPPSPAEIEELMRRVDALERAVYTPVAQTAPEAAGDGDAESEASVLR